MKKTKTSVITLLLIMLTILFISGCSKKESLGAMEYDKLPKENVIKEYTNVNKLINDCEKEDGKTKYLILAFPSCPWCKEYVPVFNEVAKDEKVELMYFNIYNYRDYSETLNTSTNVYEVDYTHLEYKKIVEFIMKNDKALENGYLKERELTGKITKNKYTLPWIYVPRLYKIENGKVVDVVKTLDGHNVVNGKLPELTKEQKEVLIKSIKQLFTSNN